MNALPPIQATQSVIRNYGILSLYDGVVPMVLRRSMDWGIRFSVSNEIKNRMLEYKREHSQPQKLAMHELIFCGLIGGAASAVTHPIDSIITNSMKPTLGVGKRRDMISVSKRMFRESGIQAFTRGWDIKILDNSYHMAWMYGIGTIAYEYLHKAINEATVQ